MPSITYVRHAMAVLDDGVHPSEWHLDGPGREAAVQWSARLEVGDGIGALVTSTEPKALETARAIAEQWDTVVTEDDRLREAVRPWIGPGYRAVAHRYLRGEQPEGWEPHVTVAERMAAAVAEAEGRAATARGPAIVVSHGLALAIHLGDRLGEDFDRETFWSRLAFPDAWALDADDVLHRSLPRPPVS